MASMPKHVELVYKDALDNLLFLKQQQWRVVNYALTAYAALFAVAKLVEARNCEKAIFVAAVVLIAAFSLLILASFKEAIEKFRARLAWIYATYFTDDQMSGLRLGEPKGFFSTDGFTYCLMAVSVGGAVFAIIAILLAWGPLS